mgnify:CR=1 FL=1
MAAFAVGMRETLSIRDALILSLVIDESPLPQVMAYGIRGATASGAYENTNGRAADLRIRGCKA